jgi:hypothetical protein
MEKNDNNKKVKDERVAKYISKYNITDLNVMYLIWFGFRNELSEQTIQLYAKSEYTPIAAEAKYMAIMQGISDVEDIQEYSDINKQLLESALSESFANQSNKIDAANDKMDMLNEKVNMLIEQRENNKVSDDFTNSADTEQIIKTLDENLTSQMAKLESGVYEGIGDIKNKLVQCIDSLLELSECNLSLLKASYDEQEFLKSMNDNPYTSKLLEELNNIKELISKNVMELQNNISGALKESRAGKKSIFAHFQKEKSDESAEQVNSQEKEYKQEAAQKKEKEEKIETDHKRKEEGIKKYNEIVTRMNNRDKEVTVVDFLNLIRTGLFDEKQAEIITEAIKKQLTIPEIIEIAKPEQSAEVMSELLSFLMATREGEEKKNQRQKETLSSKTTINKRKTKLKEENKEQPNEQDVEDDDDFEF